MSNSNIKNGDNVNQACNSPEHEEKVKEITSHIPREETLYNLAELFKVFGDSSRIKILYILIKGDMCVQHIADAAGMTQSAVSHQLRVLKQASLVRYKREGRNVIYSLADSHVKTIMNQGLEHIME